jgi:hypothetical protein
MDQPMNDKLIEVPGEPFEIAVRCPDSSCPNVTGGTLLLNFESVSHLLSDKPLRRPNRTRPQN